MYKRNAVVKNTHFGYKYTFSKKKPTSAPTLLRTNGTSQIAIRFAASKKNDPKKSSAYGLKLILKP